MCQKEVIYKYWEENLVWGPKQLRTLLLGLEGRSKERHAHETRLKNGDSVVLGVNVQEQRKSADRILDTLQITDNDIWKEHYCLQISPTFHKPRKMTGGVGQSMENEKNSFGFRIAEDWNPGLTTHVCHSNPRAGSGSATASRLLTHGPSENPFVPASPTAGSRLSKPGF